jgi:transcriptional regulator with XRE-family HTH domain
MPTTRHGAIPARPLRRVPPSDPLLRDLLGAVLRDVRTARGLTLREVAGRARVSMPYLSEVERGRKEPSSEVLAAVARALGLRLGDLLGLAWRELADRTALKPSTPDADRAALAPAMPEPPSVGAVQDSARAGRGAVLLAA